jgi:heme oxygenase
LPQQTIAPFAGPLEALGWMYVVERATPTHDEVRRYLGVRLPHACVFLSSNAGHIGQRWHAFGQALDKAARTERMANDIIAGALVGFRTWLEWSHHAKMKRSS